MMTDATDAAPPFLQNRLAQWIGWGLFILFLAWFWRIYDLFGAIPAYGDALEVVWGIEWYAQQLSAGASPFFYEGVFHPAGWQVGTLAHAPLIFLLAQPFNWIGGSNFAYNMLCLLPLVIAFVGAKRFFSAYDDAPRHFWQQIAIVLGALVFTFVTTRTNRVNGHLHIYWATSLLPLMGVMIARWQQRETNEVRHAMTAGLLWGIMLNFSLYMLFLAPLLFLLLGKKLKQIATWGKIIVSGMIALVLGAGALLLFFGASRQAGSAPSGFAELAGSGVPLNGLWIPSVWHPVASVNRVTNQLFRGVIDESGYANWGTMTAVLALIGCVYLVRSRTAHGRILFALVSMLLAMGMFVRWHDAFVQVAGLAWLNEAIWQLGRAIKPDIFAQSSLPVQYENGIPLPGYLLTAAVPFFEGARIVARFALVAGLGACGLAAVAIQRLPRWLAVPLALLWMIELLPVPAHPVTLRHQPHPAHQFVAAQGGSRVDVDRYLMHGGEALWGSWVSGTPTAAIIGSFMPTYVDVLFDATAGQTPPTQWAAVLRQFDVDYVLVHRRWPDVAARWRPLQTSDAFIDHGCFDPAADTPWQWEVCVYQVAAPINDTVQVMPVFGWSPFESWGAWTIDRHPRADFVAFVHADHMLTLEAFPHCVEGRQQAIVVRVNQTEIGRHTWQNCETVRLAWTIPADIIIVGENEVAFDLAYALPAVGDVRPLAVGVNELRIAKSE